ncbi:transcriptional regulatory protein ZraR [bacterium BMS3Abin09]|nr:transcriptional regulatory protein ZraR [bacterium BMS3Abin09]GBE40485.1 transcriptional regulatory protein ZraR [bacterium BMS3Bbin09]HDN95043.1 sigma-54-dependent Fis family transcriptional regulator [Nitrospirota bacterium]
MKPSILIVDDEKTVRYSFEVMFEDDYRVLTAEDGLAALNILDTSFIDVDIVFLDINMPGMGGIEALTKIKKISTNIPVIMMTAFSDSDTAIEAMKEGAFDYLTKPLDGKQLQEIIKKALTSSRLQHEAFLCNEIDEIPAGAEVIVGSSQAILNVCKMVGQAAGSEVPVLISGESGVGKEIVARAIYNHSNRKGNTFIAVNCAALPDGVVESELFGCEKGAFTGAGKRRLGRFEQCDKGTIFLDEIGDMSLATQAKLLRVLQDGSFERVGSSETIWADVRVIAASNKNLLDEVKQGRFREDLFHRLNVFSINILPLRKRKDDIPILSEYFLARANRETDKKIKGFSQDSMQLLKSYDWPGNVRELENAIRRACVIAVGDILDVTGFALNNGPAEPSPNNGPSGKESLKLPGESGPSGEDSLYQVIDGMFDTAVITGNTADIHHSIIARVEKKLIEKALRTTKGNQLHASELLGISRVTLRKKMQDYNINSG